MRCRNAAPAVARVWHGLVLCCAAGGAPLIGLLAFSPGGRARMRERAMLRNHLEADVAQEMDDMTIITVTHASPNTTVDNQSSSTLASTTINNGKRTVDGETVTTSSLGAYSAVPFFRWRITVMVISPVTKSSPTNTVSSFMARIRPRQKRQPPRCLFLFLPPCQRTPRGRR